MSHIFSLGDMNNFSEEIDLDELYEKKREHDLSKLDIFNKLLNRIHTKIKMTSRQRIDEQFCWFIVPEMMLGVPRYNHADCVAYLVDKLQTNGFLVKYTHPNLLLISWKHWIPGYVRTEIKKKTNINIDGYGNIVPGKNEDQLHPFRALTHQSHNSNETNINANNTNNTKSSEKDETKKLGIYSLDLFKNLKN
jgi:hypothetical protein